jgi:hypothetical protein
MGWAPCRDLSFTPWGLAAVALCAFMLLDSAIYSQTAALTTFRTS